MVAASRGTRKTPGLGTFLDAEIVPLWLSRFQSYDAVVGWGHKLSSLRARRIAAAAGRPFLMVEDGFLRSVGLGGKEPPLSLVVDDLGIYYDATRPSRLEKLIDQPLTSTETARAQALIRSWREGRVSKYNHTRDPMGELPGRFALVVDQTFKDQSIRYGLAGPASFQRMLDAALAENPDCEILVKTHPDVWAGKKKGNFDLGKIARIPRVKVLSEDCHPAELLARAEAVYTVSSQLGFEALVWGRPVRCFGMPFYAGWGLTADELPAPDRRGSTSLEQLVHAALAVYPRYVDPETGRRCEVETALENLALQRRMRSRFPETIHALSFSYWKRDAIRDFMAGSKVRFADSVHSMPEGATTAIWGNEPKEPLPPNVSLIRIEDGFLRSNGLGAELRRPLSLALDQVGLYYDSTRPSGLEQILATTEFDGELLRRAARLRERLVAGGVSKYNLRARTWTRPDVGSPVILIPGQVEEDASIRFGAPGIRRNIDLLRAVRKSRPEAHIVYKPHPDVVAGLRGQGEDEARAAEVCDEVVLDASITQMLSEVDEVHLLTSLTGFEALIRGTSVTCYGQPFYCGWGLTRDIEPIARRNRRLTLDELVAGCLILYPTYVSRVTGRFITPEQAVDSLLDWQGGDDNRTLTEKLMRFGAGIERAFMAMWHRRADRNR
jgi:capsular polysaccharide export protein